MKRFLFLTVIAISAIALGFIAGCSDDEDSPTGGSTGADTTLPEFTFVNDELGDGALDGIDMTFTLSFDLLDSIPGGVGARRSERNFSLQQDSSGGDVLIESLTYTYSYNGGWHVFTFDAVAIEPDSSDTIDVSGVDSIQITDMGIPQQTVPLTSDGLKIRNHFSMTTRVGLDTLASDHTLDFAGDVLSQIGSVTIDGSGSDILSTSYSDGMTDCDLDITNTLTISAIVLENGTNDCPTSGSVTDHATVNLACQGTGLDSLNVNGAWTVTWTFTGTTEHVTFTDGTTTWSVTQECGAGNVGNPTDTSFVSDILDDGDVMSSVFRSIDVSFALIDSIPPAVIARRGTMHSLQDGPEPVFVIINPGVYTYSLDSWHIFAGFELLVIDTMFMQHDTTTVNGTDSVQILVSGVPVQTLVNPDALDGISVRAHATWYDSTMGLHNGSVDHSIDVGAVLGVVDTIITINATAHDSMWVNDMDMGRGCSQAMGVNNTVTGLQMNVTAATNDCPLAGSMSATATVDAFCVRQGQFGDDTLQFNGTVAISATVNVVDQSITFSYDDGTVAWSGTKPCIP